SRGIEQPLSWVFPRGDKPLGELPGARCAAITAAIANSRGASSDLLGDAVVGRRGKDPGSMGSHQSRLSPTALNGKWETGLGGNLPTTGHHHRRLLSGGTDPD